MATEDEKATEKPAPKAKGPISAPVEHWAREKGMLPEFTDGDVSPARLKRAPQSPRPKLHNPKYALWARTRDSLKWDPTNWPVMTEAEFDKAVAATALHAYH
jgi:hypothetical protein